jgi:hypothetical protein
MQWDTWYDLSIRELNESTDPAKEKLNDAEAETAAAPPDPSEPEEDDEQTAA